MINIVATRRAVALVIPMAFAATAAPASAQDGYGQLLSPQSLYSNQEFAPGPSSYRPGVYGYRPEPYTYGTTATYRPRVYGYRPGPYAYGTTATNRPRVYGYRPEPYAYGATATYRPRVYGYRPGSYAYDAEFYGTGAWWRAMVMENRGGNANN
jgi:hypothetical protein